MCCRRALLPAAVADRGTQRYVLHREKRPGYRLPAADQLWGVHPVTSARYRPCQDQPGDAQFLFCRRRPGDDTGADHRLMARFVTGRKTPLPRSSRTATLTVCVATAANGSAEAACYGWRSRRASLLSRRVGRGIPTHDIPLPRRRSAPNRHPPAPWQSVSSLIPSPLKNSRTNYAKRF